MRPIHWALLAISLVAESGCTSAEATADTVPLDRLFTKVLDAPAGETTSRFDYVTLDSTTGRLFVAKMGSGKLIVFDTKEQKLTAELAGFPKATGVLAVPDLHKVYASVPGAGIAASLSVALGIAGLSSGSGAVAILSSDTLKEIARVPGGVFPDGIAYDPEEAKIFVSDEMGGAIDVIDARADKVIGRIDAGGEVGNVQFDPTTRMVYAPIQSHNEMAVVDPKEGRLVGHFPLPGGKHPHGLRIAGSTAIAYVACDSDDRLLVVSLSARKVVGAMPLGHDPDVLADDAGLKRLYVGSESGVLSVFDVSNPAEPRKLGDVFAGDDAHSVAVDPATHRLYLPLRDLNGMAAIRILEPKLQ